jgi:Pyruvate/2-oxoacid:ferredoxin oxidoreductase delta subunit
VIESIFTRCEGIVRRFAGKIFSGKKVYRGLMSIPADLLISPVALAYYIGGRFFLSKTFIANNKCNSCGICIKDCPTSSIKMVNNRPYWKLTCESCMRCMNNCPVRAIEAAHGMATAFMILITAVNTRLLVFMVDSLKIQPEIWWWKLSSNLISIAIMVIVSALLYHVVHYSMAIKPVHYLVRYTSLTTFPFWRRYTYLKNRNKNRRSE